MHIALWEPEIPPNTGNIARLCAATDCPLHLIGKLGFQIDDRAVARAGLDYWHLVTIRHHESFEQFLSVVGEENIVCIETSTNRNYTTIPFTADTCLLFGNESSGLPRTILERFAVQTYTIPMPGTGVRSLNLANSASIVLYEGLRQLHGW
ncbi:MAG: tRNA (cytidine(34)-2'-O)-methyltransferase [Zavarzinella sp.]